MTDMTRRDRDFFFGFLVSLSLSNYPQGIKIIGEKNSIGQMEERQKKCWEQTEIVYQIKILIERERS